MGKAALKNYSSIFDTRGSKYDAVMRRWPDARRREFEELLALAQIEDGDAVCDFPSGGGYMAHYISQDVSLTLLETSAAFHDLCRRNDGQRVNSVLTTRNKIPFPEGAFDKVLSLAGIHHEDDKRGFFRECARSLKPGGSFCIADVYAGSAQALLLNTFVNRHNPEGHQGIFLDDATPAAIADAGLNIEFARVISYPWVFSSEDDMAEFCAGLFGLEGLSLAEIATGIRQYLPVRHENGQVLMEWQLYFIKAVKKQ
ncbi:MAG: class I SAM-dependent methyltransferase [Alphaproteobacteria bacterium]|nr:class I SAM-dependent methyltransferase [Alphaproteobacteria bacterium]